MRDSSSSPYHSYAFPISFDKHSKKNIPYSFMPFNELKRFLGETETDNLTVSNSEIITLDFTV